MNVTSEPPVRDAPSSRRSQILEAAARLFAERGFRSVTLHEIGAAVGISGPGVYRHFPSKEALLGEMLVSTSEDLLGGALARTAEEHDDASLLAALIRSHACFALDHPELITVQNRDLSSVADDDLARVRLLQRRYVEIWVGAIRSTTDTDRDTALAAAHAVFGLLNSTPHSIRLERDAMQALLCRMAAAALSASAVRPSGAGRTTKES